VKAKFDGFCGSCGEEFWEGEDISFDGGVGRWVHDSCKEEYDV